MIGPDRVAMLAVWTFVRCSLAAGINECRPAGVVRRAQGNCLWRRVAGAGQWSGRPRAGARIQLLVARV